MKIHLIKQSAAKHSLLYLAFYTFAFAMFMPDFKNIVSDYLHILTQQTYLMHDFTETGGLAATFFNVGCHFVIAYYLMVRNTRSNLSGLQIAATGIFVGHAFFGTHLLNILPIIAGVVLYSRWTGQSFTTYTAVSLFATAAAPFVSYWVTSYAWSGWSILMAITTGLAIGFVSAPLAEQYLKFHHGFTLYNFGFTMGIITMFASITFEYSAKKIPSISYLNTTHHSIFWWYIALFIVVLLLLAICGRAKLRLTYPLLLKHSGRTPDDFVANFGYAPVCFNMALNGAIYLMILTGLGIEINGPLLGGLYSIIGFSSFGKHPLNCIPITVGVILAGISVGIPLSSSSLAITLLFCTTLCPIAGYYGMFWGIVAGFLHFHLGSLVFDLHQGMSLYNNGFASGFVAAFMVPILDTLIDNHHAYD